MLPRLYGPTLIVRGYAANLKEKRRFLPFRDCPVLMKMTPLRYDI